MVPDPLNELQIFMCLWISGQCVPKNVIKVLREACWTGAGGKAVILMELLTVLEFKSEKCSKHICKGVPFNVVCCLFVYNANECSVTAGALFRKYVSVSKKTDSRLGERRDWGGCVLGGRGLSNKTGVLMRASTWRRALRFCVVLQWLFTFRSRHHKSPIILWCEGHDRKAFPCLMSKGQQRAHQTPDGNRLQRRARLPNKEPGAGV